MHTVIETPGYLRKAKSLMSDAQREAVVTMIAADPSAGDVMTGTGGFRKIRFALEGVNGEGRHRDGGEGLPREERRAGGLEVRCGRWWSRSTKC
jgi:hypothetical protein